MSDKLDKYQKWLEIISDEVRGLTYSLDVWKQVTQIENSSSHFKKYGGHFQHWQNQNYAYRMIMTLCKITNPENDDRHRDDRNFIKLLSELKKKSYISFEQFLKMYNQELPLLPKETFVTESNGLKIYEVSICLNDAKRKFEDITGYSYTKKDFSNMLENDISKIENIFNSIKKLRNKKLAHLTNTNLEKVPNYNDIEKYVEILQKLVNKYCSIILNARIAFHFDNLNVKTVFEKAWIKND